MAVAGIPLAPRQKDDGRAEAVARRLLGPFGSPSLPVWQADPPPLAWRRAGLLAVTGRSDGPGLVSPIPLTSLADGALLALGALAPGALLPSSGALLLGERARRLNLPRRGAASANGSARLLATRDGHVALNLPRADDWDSLPALLGVGVSGWSDVARHMARRQTSDLVAQGRLLSMAIAPEGSPPAPALPFFIESLGDRSEMRSRLPLVVDLSALWAGPLAASLLGAVGARVVKVESVHRPDGARGGDAEFYDLLNAGKASVALDFKNAEDLRRLRALIDAADIVVESTRPRALEQLGIHAAAVAARGATWVSITAYGRKGEPADYAGFGDDAAVAGGLSAAMRRGWGDTLFAGDAIADPLTGIVAALAGWAAWLAGGSRLVEVALADVVAYGCGVGEARGSELEAWQALALSDSEPLYVQRERRGVARSLGADTAAVLAELQRQPIPVSALRSADPRPGGSSRR